MEPISNTILKLLILSILFWPPKVIGQDLSLETNTPFHNLFYLLLRVIKSIVGNKF